MLSVVFGFARLFDFVKLGRPKFLLGGLVMYGLGAALAAADGAAIDWRIYALGQSVVSAIQLMTHYSNDYFDLDTDRANTTPTRWSGGSRVLPNGDIAPRVALIASLILAAWALGSSFQLARRERAEPLVLPIVLLMLALSWCYSAPPLRLLSRGLGELTTALVVTLLTPVLGFYLQRGVLRPLTLLACFPLCGLQFAMLLTIELPDAAGDAAFGKRTLIVRRGSEWGARAGAVVVALSFVTLPILVLLGLPGLIATLAALSLPLGVWHCARLVRGAFRDPAHFESLALCGVALLVVPALGELAGALILARAR
jgi:1,4-dihydroxy-2-naphthoate octaprenyltransferase